MTATQFVMYDQQTQTLQLNGEWDLAHIETLRQQLFAFQPAKDANITVDGGGITKFDTSGAWLLIVWQQKMTATHLKFKLANFNSEQQLLFQMVTTAFKEQLIVPEIPKQTFISSVGKLTIAKLQKFNMYLSFVGEITVECLQLFKPSKHFRFNACANVIYHTGCQAFPIIALLSFMIGVVLAYQMGLQLKTYGADIYIVDLLGLSIVREFAPLITAIMVAGRTGSAYTAELGMMKINQEIDALNTLGVTPAEILLLPRVIGLIIALPLLTIWADGFGVFGGMVMANNILSITWYDFLHRFPHVIPLKTLIIGLGKVPVFAFIISTVGCFEGMKVKNNAGSVGENTTRSVVLAIFFIILADAVFSVVLSKMKL